MKMIKNIFTIIMSLALMLSAYGCAGKSNGSEEYTKSENSTGEKKYTALEIGSYDANDGGHHISEYPLWSLRNVNGYDDPSADRTCTVLFNGTAYVGEYTGTRINCPNTFAEHRYWCQDAVFKINAETGKLTMFHIHYPEEKNTIISVEKCREIADQFAKNYIDLDEYTVEIVDVIPQNEDEPSMYHFYYYRVVSGYRTHDRIEISVDKYGDLRGIWVAMLDSFKDVTHVPIDDEKATEALEAKLTDIYANAQVPNPDCSIRGEMTYDIQRKILTKLETGEIVLYYMLDVDIPFYDEEGGIRLPAALPN